MLVHLYNAETDHESVLDFDDLPPGWYVVTPPDADPDVSGFYLGPLDYESVCDDYEYTIDESPGASLVYKFGRAPHKPRRRAHTLHREPTTRPHPPNRHNATQHTRRGGPVNPDTDDPEDAT